MIKTLYPPDSNSESSEYTDSTKPSNNIESSLLSSGHEKPTSTDQNSHSNTDTLPLVSDDQQVCRSASSLSGSSSKRNSSAEDTSSSSSSEDELIDIVGSPPTPPSSNHQLASMTLALPVSSAVHNLSNKPRSTSPDVASHSSYVDSYTSTPKKGFSICTETVFEQSEQPDNSFEHHNSTFSQNDYERSNSFNESLAPPNIAVPPSINYQTQYSEENNLHPDNGRSDYQDNNQWHPSNYNSYSNENEHIRSESAVSQQLSVSEASGTLPEPSDDLEYDNSTDDGDTNDIEGGVPVAWEDNTRNVLSEAEDSRESIEDGHDQTGNAHGALQKPIMPLRINKSKFGDYMWASDDSASSSPAPIRLKISEPVPPPIKLRIKRDRNDKWEAASSVSSYASDVNSVSGNDSNSEENESESLNWMVTEEAENSSSASASETEQQFEEDGEDDVPFSHYES
ncbi:hypothetical protein EB796_003453 [Bugula neritina]|uniref:Uncharacterized protein n=1 Tax=Bugula neritina TaxID=10212 RepID=A0A7J7KHU3_BUGNE|nr:hypothetical protein EB796_011889 [Bugula neritina]KAF6038240.1 hypothetical protein EB796_003453 [Bugula neritina]